MNPRNLNHSYTPPPDGQVGAAVPNPFSPTPRRRWIPLALGASLLIGAGAMSGNTCNLNTGTQIIMKVDP